MKKIFVIICSVFSISAFAQQDANSSNNEPKADIKFEETVHDFSTFKEGTLASFEFIFTNTGKIPLILSNVQPSCGCTAPEWSKEPIAPGAKGKIKAIYNSYGRPGTFQKYITVKSNASSGNVDLTIKGTVLAIPPEPVSPVRSLQNNE